MTYLSVLPALAYLMEQCQSLKLLSSKHLEMNENHRRLLGSYSRPDLEIVLAGCKLSSAGASASAEVLRRNQGPTQLINCEIDHLVLADGLRGNTLESARSLLSLEHSEKTKVLLTWSLDIAPG
jgi:hypothetical protein